MDIKWSVGISYMDIYNKVSFVSYSVSAKNKDTAQLIATG